jgi:hypothetical protein
MPPKTIGDIREQRELKGKELAKILGCNPSFVGARIDKGDIAPNHPLVPKLAQALGMSVPELQVLCKKPEMTAGQLSLSKLHTGKPSPRAQALANGKKPKKKKAGGGGGGAANVAGWWTKRAAAQRAERDGHKRESKQLVRVSNGGAVVATKAGKAAAKRAYNALRLMDPETRQCARSLAMATTLAAMKGSQYLDVAIPTGGMARILNDWFRLKGIPEPVVVAVDFDEVFG